MLGGAPNLAFLDILGWYGKATKGAHTGTGMVSPLEGKAAYELHTLLRTAIETRFGLDYLGLADHDQRPQLHPRLRLHLRRQRRGGLARGLRVDPGPDRGGRQGGFGEYRAHLDNMDLVQGTYSFGDHAYRRFVERIKDAVDPNGILSPGKQGIWPASHRNNG